MKRILALLMVFLCLVSTASAATDDIEKKLAAMFDRYDTLGASVAVIQNGRVTYTYAMGEARIAGAKVAPETAFQVGSISKMVANIGLMQLVTEQGLSLDADLGDLLGYLVRHPEFPDTPITLRQLMTHTASLRDSGDYDMALKGEPKALQTLFTERAEFTFIEGQQPGTKRVYSNLGGGLIGCLIERLSGLTVDQYMQESVFAPLGITAAYQYSQLPEGTPVADMYLMPDRWISKSLRDDPTNELLPDPENHYYFTAGKLIISASDLAKLLIALCDGGVSGDERLLPESVVAEMLTPQNGRGSVMCDSANGLFLNIITDNQVEGRTMYGHGGKANGMLCAAYFDPTDRTGVVMLTNGCNNRSMYNGVGMLGRMIMRICYRDIIGEEHQYIDPFTVE